LKALSKALLISSDNGVSFEELNRARAAVFRAMARIAKELDWPDSSARPPASAASINDILDFTSLFITAVRKHQDQQTTTTVRETLKSPRNRTGSQQKLSSPAGGSSQNDIEVLLDCLFSCDDDLRFQCLNLEVRVRASVACALTTFRHFEVDQRMSPVIKALVEGVKEGLKYDATVRHPKYADVQNMDAGGENHLGFHAGELELIVSGILRVVHHTRVSKPSVAHKISSNLASFVLTWALSSAKNREKDGEHGKVVPSLNKKQLSASGIVSAMFLHLCEDLGPQFFTTLPGIWDKSVGGILQFSQRHCCQVKVLLKLLPMGCAVLVINCFPKLMSMKVFPRSMLILSFLFWHVTIST
jgi:hypothetical protein